MVYHSRPIGYLVPIISKSYPISKSSYPCRNKLCRAASKYNDTRKAHENLSIYLSTGLVALLLLLTISPSFIIDEQTSKRLPHSQSKMKLLLPSILLPLLAIASPACAAPAPHPPFTVMSARSGSPIHLLPMTARNERFWLGGKTTTYCPSNVGISCPPGKETVFAPGGTAMVRINAPTPNISLSTGLGLFVLFLSVS